jgi:hypothetical protein
MVWTVSGPFSELGKRINACNLDVAVIYFPEKIQRIYCTYVHNMGCNEGECSVELVLIERRVHLQYSVYSRTLQ